MLTDLTPAEFLRFIYPDKLATNEYIEMRCINRNDGNRPHRSWHSSITNFVNNIPQQRGIDVYYGPTTRLGHSGKKHHLFRAYFLWVDIDGVKPHKIEISKDPCPTILVDSGGGTHSYWRIGPVVLQDHGRLMTLEAVNRGLDNIYAGGKHHACDAPHILRVPGTYNYKYDKPPLVRAYFVEDNKYYLKFLRERGFTDWRDDVTIPTIPLGKMAPVSSDILKQLHALPVNGEDPSGRDYHVLARMIEYGLNAGDAKANFICSPRGKDARDRGHEMNDYVDRTLAKIIGRSK